MADQLVRVRDAQPPVAIYCYELRTVVPLSPGQPFNVDHPIVAQAPWAFYDDVEDMSAEPGKKRTVRRKTAAKPKTETADVDL